MKIDYYVSTCTKINSKWIKDLKRKPVTLKLLEKKIYIGRTLQEIVID